MKTYRFDIEETWHMQYVVRANSEAEAREKLDEGLQDEIKPIKHKDGHDEYGWSCDEDDAERQKQELKRSQEDQAKNPRCLKCGQLKGLCRCGSAQPFVMSDFVKSPTFFVDDRRKNGKDDSGRRTQEVPPRAQ